MKYITLKKAIKALYKAGVIMITSAGNCDATVASSEGGDSEGGDSTGSTSGQTCDKQKIKYPAAYSETIGVGATDINANMASYSITGSDVKVVAPGGSRRTSQVLSTTTANARVQGPAASEGGDSEGGDSEGGDGTISTTQGIYGWASGTSQAAPHVTGIVALMLSVNSRLGPAEVLQHLQKSAIALNTSKQAQAAGLVSAVRAVEKAKSRP